MKHVQNKKTAAKQEKKVLRVAAYCRVSTKLEEQEKSYDIQVDYFTEKINPSFAKNVRIM